MGVNLLLLLASIIVFALAAEGMTRLLALDKKGIEDWGTKASILRQSSEPGIGLELIPGARGKVIGGDVEISKNGLRDRVYPKKKPAGVTRVLTIGDSITFGYGVAREDSYPEKLEKLLNEREPGKWEVINFGTPGTNIKEYVSMFIKRGIEYDPDLVVLGYCLNDIDPPARGIPKRLAEGTTDVEYYQDKKRSKAVKEGKDLVPWSIPIPAFIEDPLKKHSALYRLISFRWDLLLNKLEVRQNNPVISISDTKESWKRYFDSVRAKYETAMWGGVKEQFERLNDFLREKGIRLIVVIFPFEIDDEGDYPYWPLHVKLTDYLVSIGHPPLDLKYVYERSGLSNEEIVLGGFDMIHPTEKGHAAAAGAIMDRIMEMRKTGDIG